MKISVITPTIRPDAISIVEKALKNQQFDGEFEWLICMPLRDQDIPEVILPDDFVPTRIYNDTFRGGFWTLNRVYNKLFEEAQGELVVSLQDNIWVPPDGLQKFWDAYEEQPKALISGVGDQYEKIEEGRPMVKIWSDPRKTDKYGTFYECMWNDCEWNWAAIPKMAWASVGGLDEKLDFLGFGGDQLEMCDRLDDAKIFKFFIDQENESFTVRHDRSDHGGEENWDKNHVLFNEEYAKRKNELIKKKQWPVLLDFGR